MSNELDFTLTISEAAREGLGEDSWCRCHVPVAELLGVFDGCGGSGARKQDCYSGYSEAYMASRLCAGAFYDAFDDYFSARPQPVRPQALLTLCGEYCQRTLKAHRPPAQSERRIVSSMITTLPTTAAAVAVRQNDTHLELTLCWAGDSRIYALCPGGLMQLSKDDSEEDDPFETDGLMTNTLNADKAPQLHFKRLVLPKPAVVFCATDGCFAYFRSPMEFEGALLTTMAEADFPEAWRQLLIQTLGEIAGDDYTLVAGAYAFGRFDALKASFRPRLKALETQYLAPLRRVPLSDQALRRALWETYRSGYSRYLGGNGNANG